ncbi:MAG: quinol dehydrogenase ferredoxin subunit NapH [Magnetococcales bacterium]|nr:quinol dehydrogenase ferredoxin subunit NapH [Magnetococcales bacterium]
MKRYPGPEAREKKGWWLANRWLLLRRLCQLSVLILFLLGPWLGVWLAKGNLSSSKIMELLPMTDLLLFAQLVLAHGVDVAQAVPGALVVLGLYLVLGGRFFCAWVCPINPVTDSAAWLRARLGISWGWQGTRTMRQGMLVLVLLLAGATGMLVWEWVNPVAIAQRSILFGMTWGWLVMAAIFLFDLLISRHGWCGRLCPTGALYALLSPLALLRVGAAHRENCNDCMDCYLVCPEPQVIDPALKGAKRGIGPTITAVQCTNCGRCIDVCPESVYRFGFHLPNKSRVP